MAALKLASDVLFAAAFAALLGAPLARRLATGEDDPSAAAERRQPAPYPELRLEEDALAQFPAAYERWLADSFNYRGTLIRWHNALKLLGLGVAPTPKVLVGRDGWLFLRGERALDCWRGIDPFTEEELETWRRVLEARRDWCAAREIEYRFFVPPNKHTVYPEQLPAWVTRVNSRTRLDQLVRHMRERSDLRVLDAREALAAARGRGLLYYPHGTHWNDRGAYVGYRLLLELSLIHI